MPLSSPVSPLAGDITELHVHYRISRSEHPALSACDFSFFFEHFRRQHWPYLYLLTPPPPRTLYNLILSFFLLTSWRLQPSCWAFALYLLFSLRHTHPAFLKSERIPLTPFLVRELRAWATAYTESSSLACFSSSQRVHVLDILLELNQQNCFRLVPERENWGVGEIWKAHEEGGNLAWLQTEG